MLPDPGNEMPKPHRHVNTSLRMELCETRPTMRQLSAKTDMSWSTPRRPTTVPVHRCPSFTFTTAFLIHAIRGYLREDYRKSWLSPAVNGYNDFADYIPK